MSKVFGIFLFIFLSFFSLGVSSEDGYFEYTPGRGLKLKPLKSTVGGYITLYYEKDYYYKNKAEILELDDVAIFIFGRPLKNFRYFIEIEADEIAGIKLKGKEKFNRRIFWERAYIDILFNEHFKLRIGRFITPIGFWNPIHINVLKWTTSDPFTALKFFPRFTTGVRIFGNLPYDINYSLFYQNNKGISEDYNNYLTRKVYGLEIEKKFSHRFTFKVNFGSFKIKKPKERIDFSGVGFLYRFKRGEFSMEYMYGKEDEEYLHYDSYRESFYAQWVYGIFRKNFLILRYDYFKDKSDGLNISSYTIGWNFKPVFYVSFKAEYQFSTDYDRLFISFSWMF